MTAPYSIDPTRFLSEQLEQASPNLLRQMLQSFITALMGAEADAVCGAEYGQASTEPEPNPRHSRKYPVGATTRCLAEIPGGFGHHIPAARGKSPRHCASTNRRPSTTGRVGFGWRCNPQRASQRTN